MLCFMMLCRWCCVDDVVLCTWCCVDGDVQMRMVMCGWFDDGAFGDIVQMSCIDGVVT